MTQYFVVKKEREVERLRYVSERIINIAELEDRIQVARISVDVLKNELSKIAPSKDTIERAVNTAVDALHAAENFEFMLEKRICTFTDSHEHPKE